MAHEARSGGGPVEIRRQDQQCPAFSREAELMIVLIDNYDSFTYNLVQRLGELNPAIELRVFRNDEIALEDLEKLKPSRIIISPGPCTPKEAGISNAVLERFAARTPIL